MVDAGQFTEPVVAVDVAATPLGLRPAERGVAVAPHQGGGDFDRWAGEGCGDVAGEVGAVPVESCRQRPRFAQRSQFLGRHTCATQQHPVARQEHLLGTLGDEILDVRRLLALIVDGVRVFDRITHRRRMASARHNQAGEPVGVLTCEVPGDDSAPVVTDENRVRHVERIEYAECVVDECLEPVGLDPLGTRPRAVAALVDLDGAQTGLVQAVGDVVVAGAVHREPVQQQHPGAAVRTADANVEGQVADCDLAPLSFHSTNPSGGIAAESAG